MTCDTKGGHHRLEELISIECIFFNKTVISYWHQLNAWFTGCNLWNPRWQMGAQWISNQKSSSIICWVPFLQFNTGFGYFLVAGEVFWKCLFLICIVQEFCFFVFENLHNTCITSQEHRSKINTLETKDFFIKESLLICFRSVPCFWILMSLLISWLRGLFNLLLLSESSQGDLKWWWMMMIMNSLFFF